MDSVYLKDVGITRDVSGLGNKGQGLHWLAKHHLTIPDTLALTFQGSERLSSNGHSFDPELGKQLGQWVDEQKSYAVRSSANVEDGQKVSFAGQFTTRTNVCGMELIQDAVLEVIESMHSPALEPYISRLGESGATLRMAVLVQEMVQPQLSGVAFSKNPTTGLDEVVIEAVEGLAEALVQGGITPDRWIFRWGEITSRPEGKEGFDRVIAKIASETKRIARLYGAPVDMEWAFDGQKIYWLQIRPITVLAQIPIYSNRIAREVLPGVIKPLISSINIPLVNRAWIRLFDRLLGPTHLEPEELTRMFHYRAYFNMAPIGTIFELLGFPRESLEMLLGLPAKSQRPSPSLRSLRHLPRLLLFAMRAWNYDRRVASELAAYEKSVREIQQESLRDLSEGELIERIEALFEFNINLAYQNIIIPLLMNLFNRVLKLQLERAGINFVEFDVTNNLEGLEHYDPNASLDSLKQAFLTFPPELQDALRELEYDQLIKDPRFVTFGQQLALFIERFGHLSESGSDFSRVPWRELPAQVLSMVVHHPIKQRGQEKITWETCGLPGSVRWRVKPIYKRARRLRLRREQISSIYTASYGWFRELFKYLAERFVAKGMLAASDDIFYLDWREVQLLADDASQSASLQALIERRKQEVAESQEVQLPETIYGNSPPPLARVESGSKKRSGIPTSPGYYQGRLKIILSTDEFNQVEQGDVIAIPHSDVAWTPLFAKAGAVIAEAGGMLSHSSIVAREYGIPCVVSVTGATSLPKNSCVYVDGYQGEVSILE